MKKILLLLAIPAILAACIVDQTEKKGDSREVEIRLSASDSPKTRAAGNDATIHTVDILVFDNTETPDEHADAEFRYSRYAVPKGGNVYNAILKIAPHLDLYFAVNARTVIANAALTEGMTWSQVHEVLVMEDPDEIDMPNDGLPMWGYRHEVEIKETVRNNFGTIRLLRAVASADIDVASTAGFTLEAGYIVYGADKGYLSFTAAEANMDFGEATGVDIRNPQADFKLKAPEIPTGTVTNVDWRYEIPELATANQIKDVFYFYENEGPNDPYTNGREHYTKVILEGKWHDPGKAHPDSYVTTYYPVALRDPAITDGSNARIPVIRNHKFKIAITKVNGPGYPTVDEAKKGEDLNMEYQVIPWYQWNDGSIFIDGSKFISLTRSRNENMDRMAWLYRNKKSTDVIEYTANISPDQLELSLYPTGDAATLTDAEKAAGMVAKIANQHFEIAVYKDGIISGTDEIYGRFVFTALHDYASSPPSNSILTVTFGRISFEIQIGQRNSAPEDWIDGGNKDEILGQ